jgi:hypothetical protein
MAVAKTRKPARKWPQEIREKALAVYRTTGSSAAAARSVGCTVNTFKRWLTAPVTEEVKKAREDAQVRFVGEAWNAIMDGIQVARQRMSFMLENADKIDKAFEAVADADIPSHEKARLLKVMANLTNISLSEIAIFNGTHFDKIRLTQGKPTGIEQVDGQVRHDHEHSVSLTLRQILDQRAGGTAPDDALPALLRRGASLTS